MNKFTFGFMLVSFTCASFAKAGSIQEPAKLERTIQDKVAIRPEDLPEAVKNKLAGNTYADWKVTGVYLITKEDNTKYFEINIRKEEETATLNVDKDGKIVD